MPVLDSACVTTQQPGSPFQFRLTETTNDTKLSESLADIHNQYRIGFWHR